MPQPGFESITVTLAVAAKLKKIAKKNYRTAHGQIAYWVEKEGKKKK